jgi:putative alpha-1,2-mannosidase
MGFYPVCPGTQQYVIGAPLFKKTTVTLENGKQLVLSAPANSAENRYIKAMKFNNQPYTNNWLDHKEIMKGATITFDMDAVPNKNRGISDKDVPYSLSQELK